MRSYTFAGLLIILAFTARHVSSKQLCDIRIWYLNLITDEVFNIELNSAQLQLKNSIETLVLNSAGSEETRKTDCHILQMYDDMLKETFNYKQVDAGMEVEDQQLEKEAETNNKGGAQTQGEGNKDNENKPEQENAIVDSSGEKDNGNTKEGKDSKEDEKEKGSKTQKENSEDSNEKPDEYKSSKESDSKLTVESADNEEKEGSDIVNTTTLQENDQIGSVDAKDDKANGASEELDETELFEDESEIEEELENSEGDLSAEPSTNEASGVNKTEEIKDIRKTSPHPISFGISRLNVCYLYDVFDVFYCQENNANKDTNTTRQELSNNVCNLGRFCTEKCYYVYSISFCTIGYSNRTVGSQPDIKTNVNEMSQNDSEDYKSTNVADNVNENNNSETDSEALETNIPTHDVSSGDSEGKHTHGEETMLKSDSDETVHKAGTLQHETNNQGQSDVSKEDDQRNMDEQIAALEKEELKLRSDLQEPKHSEPDVTNLQNKSERSRTVTAATNENKNADKDQSLSFKEFEEIINRKTSEYGPKIQTLELMIMKLENQLLTEKLNKQNHSSTITKLENLILKLENDLLKINKNYQNLKFDTENMSKKQSTYLELANKQQEQMSKRLELPDHSTKSFELVSQHQSRINELSDMLKNQSALINKLKQRYDTLEDQNLRLHQMIMNQTIFMTSIIQTVQDLSEQNNKNKLEMDEMKRTISETLDANSQKEKPLSSLDRDIISKLESLVFGSESASKLKRDLSTKDTTGSRKQNVLSEKSIENIFKWCTTSNQMSATCIHHSFIKSKCIPFKQLVWSSCNSTKFNNSKPENEVKVSELPDVPDVPDHRTDENKDDEDILSRKNLPSTMGIDENKMGENKNKLDEINDNDSKETKQLVSEKNVGEDIADDKHNQDETQIPSKTKETQFNIESQEYKSIEEKDYPETKDDKTDAMKDAKLESHSSGERKEEELVVSKENIGKKKDEGSNTEEEKLLYKKKEIVVEKSGQKSEAIQSKGTSGSEIDKQTDSHVSNTNDVLKEKDAVDTPKADTVKKEKVDTQATKPDKLEKKVDEATKPPQEKSSNNAQKQTGDAKETKKGGQPKPGTPKKVKDSEASKKPMQRKVPINLEKSKSSSDVKDCYDHYRRGMKRDGLFKVKPVGAETGLEVFCDMRNGGWTVIQRRQDGSTNFFQEWDNYKKGFGGLYGEHWLGNDNLHTLTNQDYYQLRVDLMDWDKKKKVAVFDYFLVDSEDDGYRLHIDGYSGDAGDGLTKHNGHKFSTKDVDNDKVVKEFGGSCAKRFHGAGWYYKCYASNLNGKYYRGGKIPEKQFDGVTWKPWTGPNYSIKKVEMKIRPASAAT